MAKKQTMDIAGLADFMSDPNKEEEGSWRDLEDGSDRRFLIAFGNNSKYQAKLARLIRPKMSVVKRRDEKAMRVMNKIQGRAMSGTVLLDWEGIKDGGGRKIPFSVETGETILTDPRYRKLREMIEEFADIDEAELDDAVDEAAKN
jgi:hypothetical protein